MEAIKNIIPMVEKGTPSRNRKKTPYQSSEYQEYNKGLVTAKEVLEKGYEHPEEGLEAPIKCEFCGKTLYQIGLFSPITKRVFRWSKHENCDCKDAIKKKEIEDLKKEQLRKELEEEKRREEQRAKLKKLIGDSGIKKRFRNRTFENFKVDAENQQAYNNAKAYAEHFQNFKEAGEGIYFSGTWGTGKTHLAVAIALHLINEGVPVICMTSTALLAEIRSTFDKNRHISEYELLKAYKEVDLLIIDDLGKENCTDWAIAQLYDIINDRYENCLPTIITTNFSNDDLVKRLGEKSNMDTAGSIVSRLHEMTMGITMNGRDRRKIY